MNGEGKVLHKHLSSSSCFDLCVGRQLCGEERIWDGVGQAWVGAQWVLSLQLTLLSPTLLTYMGSKIPLLKRS